MKRYKVTHIMNKNKFGLILVAGLLSSTASALDLDPDAEDAGTVVIANEVEIGDGIVAKGTVMGPAGFIIPANSGYFARFDLGGGATFAQDLTNFSVTGTGIKFQIAAGAEEDDDYAVMSVSGEELISLNTVWTLRDIDYNLPARANVSFKYSLYQDAINAVNENDPLETLSDNLFAFADATSMDGDADDGTLEIDVANSGKTFDNPNPEGLTDRTTIMVINITETDEMATNPLDDGLVPTLENVVDEITFTVSGNFGALRLADPTADPAVTEGGKVWLDATPECLISAADDDDTESVVETRQYNLGKLTVSDSRLSAEIDLLADAPMVWLDGDSALRAATWADYANVYVCMQTDGVQEIPEVLKGFKGKLVMKANDDFNPIGTATFGGSVLKKNSDVAEVHFLLTPDGHFRNYVRLSNTSTVPVSNLRVTLINDEGNSQTFNLDEIDGISADLAAQASTKLININAMYAAAQAEELGEDEEMFTVTGGEFGNKLRARVDGSFPEGSIDIQVLSISRDNQVFFVF